MGISQRPENLFSLAQVLPVAEQNGFAIGSFSARVTMMIEPILRAGQKLDSPIIVQISQKELERYLISAGEFADEFYRQLAEQKITVPVVLHLDHTKTPQIISDAIDAGFTSVMIDASEKSLDENIAISKQVAEYAHARRVSVEAELGQIGTTDRVETEADEELFTDPMEAQRFVEETQVDALAVSVGTAHGVYLTRQPRIDYQRLMEIRKRTPVAFVIHGGSGIPAEMLAKSYTLPGGGVSKVNIATDLELAALQVLDRSRYLTNPEFNALPKTQLKIAQAAVEAVVTDKIERYVRSSGKAVVFRGI